MPATSFVAEWRDIKTTVPDGCTYDRWLRFVEFLYGLTPADANDKRCQKWAEQKAQDIYPALHREGMSQH